MHGLKLKLEFALRPVRNLRAVACFVNAVRKDMFLITLTNFD
jgi:hypothetical protein